MSSITKNSPNEHLPKNLHYNKLAICIGIGTLIWFLPHPVGVNPKAWHLLAIFISTIVGLIIKPLPMGALTILALSIALVTKTFSLDTALAGFSSNVVWLVIMAFFIAKAFVVTGFGNRIAYFFTGIFGKKSLGLGYSVAITNFMLSPAIPSATARAAGIVYPIVQGISRSYESFPHNESAKKIGKFLTLTAFQSTPITSAMFMTSMAANPFLVELAATQNIKISWTMWAMAAIVPGILSLIVIPFLIYKIYPPEIKETPNAAALAKEQLKEMGPPSKNEWVLFGTLLLLLALWGAGSLIGMPTVEAAIIGISILLVTGVLNWKALLKEHDAWETFIWFSILLVMAKELNTLGLMEWFSNFTGDKLIDVNWKVAFPIISLLYFYSHYLFASSTAHISSMFLPFLVIAIGAGTPPMLATLSLIFISNIFGCLTHYSTTPAPLLYGAGYVEIKPWWNIGFIMSVVNILIWGSVGIIWWKVLGMW